MDFSDDDMFDTESGEDTFYIEEGADLDYGFTEVTSQRSHLSYVVIKEEDIRKQQSDNIEQVSTVLSITQVESIALLLHYRWNVSKVQDEWFTDEERVRELVGVLKDPVVDDLNEREVNIECGGCFELYPFKEIATVSCGHPYCNTCWTGYITVTINDGPGCLMLKCPEPYCSAVVGQDIIDKVITQEEVQEKYYKYFVRSYVGASGKKIKWCPSPGCEHAVEFGSGTENYDVSCLCSYEFCWNCGNEAHRPVDCETVSKWILKNSAEFENTNWILENAKPCPKCNRQIPKSQGCNNMRCSICKHGFCWACLSPLAGHKNCHKFEGGGNESETEIKKERANRAIDKYMHYYERWANNESARLKATADLIKLRSFHLKKLGTPETRLQFTIEAWLQIIECRRVLKWTYAYGYYIPQEERTKKHFFEYLQGEAEDCLERLHHYVEMEFKQFINKTQDDPSKSFDEFRSTLVGLTKVTKTYFENLVKALENGLADVEYNETKSTKADSKTSNKRQKLVK